MDYNKFIDLLCDGIIKVDVRLGIHHDGKTHDHGTAFRIKLPAILINCSSI